MSSDQSSIQTKLNEGHAALWEHDWDSAVQAYNKALAAAPDNDSALAGKGLALFHQKRYTDSLRIFQELTRKNPNDPMPMERIARIYEREGLLTEAAHSFYQAGELQLKNRDVDRALSDYRTVLRFDPENQNVRARLGMVFSKLGKKQEAVAEFIDLAAIVQQSGDPSKAMQILEYALQIKPDSTEVQNAVAALKRHQQIPLRALETDINEALRMAQVREIETAQVVPDSQVSHDPIMEARLNALEELADLLFEENDFTPSGKKFINRLISKREDFDLQSGPVSIDRKRVQTHVSHAIDLHSTGNDEQAAVELEKAIKSGLQLPAADFLIGLLTRQNDSEKALEHLQKANQDPSYALASHLLSGEINLNKERLAEATTNYLHALMLADSETVNEDQALELIQLYEPILESQNLITQEKDMRNLCAAISGQLNRQDWRAYLKGAREQLPQLSEDAPPLPIVEMLIDSNSSRLVESLAEMKRLVEQGKHRTAMEESFRALSYAPNYLPLHTQMGEILISEGRVAEAIEKFLLVTKLYTIRGNTTAAIRLLNKVSRLAPMDITVRKSLIDLLSSSGNQEEVIQQYIDLGNVYYLLADLNEARRAYHSALNLSRQNRSSRDQSIKILNRLADIELQSLNWKEAILVYEQMRNLLPSDPAPRIALVDLYFRFELNAAAINEVDAFLKLLESENRKQDAEKFLDDLLVERPENIDLQKRVTSYYASRGQMDTAIMKLDALAEKLLVQKKTSASAAVVAQIIALNPPNRSEYERLYTELSGG